jgi:hypothetical protein
MTLSEIIKDYKIFPTICVTIVCTTMLIVTNGKHGIGWFLLFMFLIWG